MSLLIGYLCFGIVVLITLQIIMWRAGKSDETYANIYLAEKALKKFKTQIIIVVGWPFFILTLFIHGR